jgi:two-component system cell cycle sensor histidine kinase/response regulator CckA
VKLAAKAQRTKRLSTVRVPRAIQPLFRKAQEYVSRYFAQKVESPRQGTISISGERYILLRAASMSVEFFDLVTSLYQDKGAQEATSVASNLLFDMAHAIGKADARAFHRRMGVTDPIEKLSAGPIHFSFAGWAFVNIFAESNPSPDEDYVLVYEHPFSFESDAWRKRGRQSELPVCVMSAGYSSGWCEESFGLPLVAVEVECLAARGRHCRFVMAPPSRIEAQLRRHSRRAADRRSGSGTRIGARRRPVSIPEFFQRKRLEDELRQSHANLERRVAERTAELTESNQRLRREIAERRRAEEARDEFLSVAAHELKTPMTSLRGFAQLLGRQLAKGRQPDPRRLLRALSAIDGQSEKLSRLVSRLLDVSRLQAGRLVLERRPSDVRALVEGVLVAAAASGQRHRIALSAPAAVEALVDPLRLEQVVTNLIDNAAKYSPARRPIEVEVAKLADVVRIVVRDRGIGVPRELRERIFERFFQAHPAHRLGGLGLGLYISRQIVELHGGRIAAEFPPGRGTRVVVELPLGLPRRRSKPKRVVA